MAHPLGDAHGESTKGQLRLHPVSKSDARGTGPRPHKCASRCINLLDSESRCHSVIALTSASLSTVQPVLIRMEPGGRRADRKAKRHDPWKRTCGLGSFRPPATDIR